MNTLKNQQNTIDLLLLEKVEEVKSLILKQNTITIRKWIDFKSAVLWSGCSSSTLDRAIRKGTLKVSKANGKRMFTIVWLDAFMEGK